MARKNTNGWRTPEVVLLRKLEKERMVLCFGMLAALVWLDDCTILYLRLLKQFVSPVVSQSLEYFLFAIEVKESSWHGSLFQAGFSLF